MGVIRVIMKKDSILESNMVQTIGSAGESLAAGAIFTLPVLFLWSKEGITEAPSLITISLIALFGGILGVLFMVPLRNALIVKEHGVLPYPEGTACAEVLLAGEEGGASAKSVFAGMGLAALFKFVVDGLKVIPSVITDTTQGIQDRAFSRSISGTAWCRLYLWTKDRILYVCRRFNRMVCTHSGNHYIWRFHNSLSGNKDDC